MHAHLSILHLRKKDLLPASFCGLKRLSAASSWSCAPCKYVAGQALASLVRTLVLVGIWGRELCRVVWDVVRHCGSVRKIRVVNILDVMLDDFRFNDSRSRSLHGGFSSLVGR